MSYFDIVRRRPTTLIRALRVALERIQERERLTPDDPALIRLKQSILASITELDDRQNASDREAPPESPSRAA